MAELEHVRWLHLPCHCDFRKSKWFHVVSNSMRILTNSECFTASRIISHTKVWLNGMIYLSWEQFVSLNGEKFVNLLLVYLWTTPYSCIMAVWFIYLNRDVSYVWDTQGCFQKPGTCTCSCLDIMVLFYYVYSFLLL
jgi:hypothetical protein